MKYRLLLGILFLFVTACAPSRLVTPLKKDELALGAGFGGPLIKLGNAVIPIPYATIQGGYGVTSDITVTGGAHLTAAAFGVAMFETGALFNVWNKDSLKQGITAHVNLNTAFGHQAFRIWPQTDLNYYYRLNKKSALYSGVSAWYELNGNTLHGEPQSTFIIPSWQAGYTYSPSSWTWQLEAKVIAPHEDNRYVVADYISPLGSKGAFGVYVTVSKRFGK